VAAPWDGRGSAVLEARHGWTERRGAPEKEKRRKSGQTVMDSGKEVYHGVQNEEGYLVVVTEFARTR